MGREKAKMKLIEAVKEDKIHNRKIDVTTYELDDNTIMVYGELIDRRLVDTYSVEDESIDAGIVHHMRICLKVNLTSLTIEEIEVELPVTPKDECGELEKSLDGVKGLRVTSGFTYNVKTLVGGRKGCIHLTTLLLTMAPAILQGYWVHGDRDPKRRNMSGEHIEKYLIDGCYVWRREGPLVEKIAGKLGISFPPLRPGSGPSK
jgi:hypothetical protein